MEKYRGIRFKFLPKEAQVKLADLLDQEGDKDYFVFAQNLEKEYGYQHGTIEPERLRVLRHINKRPTMGLFDVYSQDPRIYLDAVYRVLQDMLLTGTDILDEYYKETCGRFNAENYNPPPTCPAPCEHRCTCEQCMPFHSVDTRDSVIHSSVHMQPSPTHSTHSCFHQNIAQASPAIPLTHSPPPQLTGPLSPRPIPQYICPHSRTVHGNRAQPAEIPHQRGPVSSGLNGRLQRRPPNSSSTLQIPLFADSSFVTRSIATSAQHRPYNPTGRTNQPEVGTGAIPNSLHSQNVSVSQNSYFCPLEMQRQEDGGQQSLSRQTSMPSGNRHGHPQTNTPVNMSVELPTNRLMPHGNNLGQIRPNEDTIQCTCPVTSVPSQNYYDTEVPGACANPLGADHSSLQNDPWIAPDLLTDSSDDEEDTKVLEVVTSSEVTSSSSQCTCSSQYQRRKKADDDRRHSDPPPGSVSSSDNCSGGIRHNEELVYRRSSSEELMPTSTTNNLSPRGAVPSPKQPDRRYKLFLTFADDSEQHIDEVLSFGKELKDMGFLVKCDMFEQTINMLIRNPNVLNMENSLPQCISNSNDWLEYHIKQADFLVVCISPRYHQYVKPVVNDFSHDFHGNIVNLHDADAAQPSNCQLHAKYIYNQAFDSHVRNLSTNMNCFPVLFSNSGANRTHIPSIFCSTIVFTYPDVRNSLQTFLKNYVRENNL